MGATGTLADGTSRLSLNGTTLHHFNSVSSFAGQAVVPASVAVKVRDDVRLDTVALVGCAVLTGVGAAVNTARIQPGESAAIVGLGGVGLACLLGARACGAGPSPSYPGAAGPPGRDRCRAAARTAVVSGAAAIADAGTGHAPADHHDNAADNVRDATDDGSHTASDAADTTDIP